MPDRPPQQKPAHGTAGEAAMAAMQAEIAGLKAELAAQKEFYEKILNGIPADIGVLNDRQQYVFISEHVIPDAKAREWLAGKTDEEYCSYVHKPPAAMEIRKEMFARAIAEKKPVSWLEQKDKTSGRAAYLSRHIAPVTNAHGEVDMLIGFGTDITAQKETEEGRTLSEKRYREIFNFSQAWICTHDMSGIITTINPAACRILGYTEKELTGMPVNTLLPEKLKQAFNNEYLAAIKEHGKAEGVMHVLSSAGKSIFLLYQNYLVNEPGTQPYIIGFAQDITERRQAEEALKRSEEKYRSIIENMNMGMLETDGDERIIYANQQSCTMSGYTLAELANKNVRDLFLLREEVKGPGDKRQKRQLSTASYELSIKTKKGETRWWLVSTAPMLNERGDSTGAVTIHLDITRQKKMEQQLRDAKQEAERSSEAKEMFLTNMSHEIRTPINAIMGLGRLMEKSHLDGQQQYYLASMRTASENLLAIISDVLDLSKIEAGQIMLERIPFDLKKITRQTVSMLTHKAEEKGLVLSCSMDERIAGEFTGDPFRINQVLMNMISNAIKFTSIGSVSLAATMQEDTGSHQHITITISDTGVGISQVFIDNIFNKFTQEDESIAREFGGTGLGMSITRQLMELMGGTISISSEKDKGTLVSLHFRLKISTGKVLEKKSAAGKTDTGVIKDSRILLVEDNALNRLLALTILRQYGAIVAIAENGAQALEQLRTEKFDIVLMDVQMPVMDGIAATRAIRQDISATVPIIALTANAIKGKREQYMQAGMNDAITKPYEEEKMVALIATWLAGKAVHKPGSNKGKATKQEKAAAKPSRELYSTHKLYEMSYGNKDFVKEILLLFTADVPVAAQTIKEAYTAEDYTAVRQLAHSIRPSLESVMATGTAAGLREIEQLAQQDNPAAALEKILNSTLAGIAQIVAAIKEDHNI